MVNLVILFAAPFLLAAIAFLIKLPKNVAFTMSLLPLLLLVYGHSHWIGSQINVPWLPAVGIQFHLSIDPLSLLFLYLTAIIVPISFIAVNPEEMPYPNAFYGLAFLLEGLLFGFFTAQDLAVFTIFWESMLLPLYFMINLAGGEQRQRAALKFLIYMIAGSVFLVAAVLALYFASLAAGGAGTFNLTALTAIASTVPYAPWLCAIFLLAFAVKTPLFPFHAWLPDAYCRAPVAGTILLSALLSKAGIYGILRVGMGLFAAQIHAWSPFLIGLAIAGVFYGALAAWSQTDFKRLIAYSSFSHVNFILAGLFIGNAVGQSGAILQALNHGITIAGLFLVAGWLERRLGTTEMPSVGGLAKFLPQLCWLTLVFVLSSVALPGTNNFVGELLILFGLFQLNPWMTALLAVTIVLSVVYMLRLMQNIYFGPPSPFQTSWTDITPKQIMAALPLVALIFLIGIYPAPILKLVESTVITERSR